MYTEVSFILFILILSGLPSKSLCSFWGNIRLVDGDTPFDGRPEVFISKWKPFCDSYLHPNVAKVICRMLRMPINNVTLKSNKYVDNWDTWIVCDEDDRSLVTDCGWKIWPDPDCWGDAGLSCNGNVRLTDGTNSQNGNLELFHDGILTSICDHDPDFKVAKVVCRQLGLDIGRSALTLDSYFGPGHPSTVQVTCGGNELSIEQCRYQKMTCTSRHVLGVNCNATQYELEAMQLDYRRWSVDINTFDVSGYWSEKLTGVNHDKLLGIKKIASVLCYELGYSRYNPGISEIPFDGRFAYPLQLSDAFVCSGLEDSLSECSKSDDLNGDPSSANSSTEIAVTCNGVLDLHGGDTYSSGILMRRNDTDGTWQPFADMRPDYAMALVTCRELGYSISNVQIELKNLEDEALVSVAVDYICSGDEMTLRDCQAKYDNIRRSTAVIGLNCNATVIALAETQSNTTEGYVVKHLYSQRSGGQTSSAWSRVCHSKMIYDVNTAAVICHQLGYARSGAKMTLLPLNEDSVYFDNIAPYACIGSEDSLSQCPVYGELSQDKCLFEISMDCQDVSSCADTDISMPSKIINCHAFHCLSGYCYDIQPFKKEPCLLESGQGCMISKTYIQSNTGSVMRAMLGRCDPSCEAQFSRALFEFRSDECCFKEMCNSNTTVVRDEYLFRVTDGIFPWEGFVQFYSNSDDKWFYIHDHAIVTNEIVGALCVGSGYFANSFARSPNTGKTYPYDKMCALPGSEDADYGNCNVQDLSSGCFVSQKACPEKNRLRINCNAYAPKARLVDGGSERKGRVELYFLNQWGTVCTRGINKGVSDVLCRSLGFHGGCSLNTTTGTHRARFPAGEGSIHFENVSCIGTEDSILQCNYSYLQEETDCSHLDDLGIICEDATSVIPESSESQAGFTTDEYEEVYSNTVVDEAVNETVDEDKIDKNLNSMKFIKCFKGRCKMDNCRSNFLGLPSLCVANQSAYCYRDQQETRSGISDVYAFGCIDNCLTGITRNGTGQVKTRYCCKTELCNVNNGDIKLQFSKLNMSAIMVGVNSTENNTEWMADILENSTEEIVLTTVSASSTDNETFTSQGVVNTVCLWIIMTQIACIPVAY